jgi:hypothetical protein
LRLGHRPLPRRRRFTAPIPPLESMTNTEALGLVLYTR